MGLVWDPLHAEILSCDPRCEPVRSLQGMLRMWGNGPVAIFKMFITY